MEGKEEVAEEVCDMSLPAKAGKRKQGGKTALNEV
jgi:hypothetical protein